MFTGLVELLADVVETQPEAPGIRLVIAAGQIAKDTQVGDSIAINGCCLTVIERDRDRLAFQAGEETLSRTNLGQLKRTSRVNIERSLVLGHRLGGHLVTGHIDGQGALVSRTDDGDWSTCWFSMPRSLAAQIVPKGSIAVDGVSLTVVRVEDERFSVALIPHTLKSTTLGDLAIGDPVNLETDLIAKYVEKQLSARSVGNS